MKNYGLPYQGSKNDLVSWVLERIPSAGTFVDLFCGGCAITHGALLIDRWGHYIANDICGIVPQCFLDAIHGEYSDETRWISREDFHRLKDTDGYIRTCWSFSANGVNYLYSREVEPWKKAVHYARVLGDCSLLREFSIDSDGSSADIIKHHDEYKSKYIRWWLSKQQYTETELNALIEKCKGDIAVQEEKLRQYLLQALKASGLTQAEVQHRLGTQMAGHYFGRSQWAFPTQEMYERMQEFMPGLDKDYNDVIGLTLLWKSLQSLQSLQRLQSLQSLQSLQRLQSLQSLQISSKDYREIELPDDCVVYADPPYKGTSGYNGANFDSDAFWDWCRKCPHPVYISEYTAPDDFIEIASISHTKNLGHNTKSVEKLFCNREPLKTTLF